MSHICQWTAGCISDVVVAGLKELRKLGLKEGRVEFNGLLFPIQTKWPVDAQIYYIDQMYDIMGVARRMYYGKGGKEEFAELMRVYGTDRENTMMHLKG